jgi:hypothetical protein
MHETTPKHSVLLEPTYLDFYTDKPSQKYLELLKEPRLVHEATKSKVPEYLTKATFVN